MSDTLLEIRQKSQDVKGRGSNTVHEDFDVKDDNHHPSHFLCSFYVEKMDNCELYLRRQFRHKSPGHFYWSVDFLR